MNRMDFLICLGLVAPITIREEEMKEEFDTLTLVPIVPTGAVRSDRTISHK